MTFTEVAEVSVGLIFSNGNNNEFQVDVYLRLQSSSQYSVA